MQALVLIFILAIVVEAVIEYLGVPIPSRFKPYTAALLGVLLCVGYGADLLAALGYAAAFPFVGAVLTGLVIGRGSNYVADFVKRLRVITAPAEMISTIEQGPTEPMMIDRPRRRGK